MKNNRFKLPYFSPDLKRRIAAAVSVILVVSAAVLFSLKNRENTDFVGSESIHYEMIKNYMQTEYVEAYSDYFEVAYVEELENYNEMLSQDGGSLEATFIMKAYYRYPYRNPDTVPQIMEAREKGDMKEYKRLYDEYNQIHSADYSLKIDAEIDGEEIKKAVLFSGTEEDGWIRLENGLKDYITEE